MEPKRGLRACNDETMVYCQTSPSPPPSLNNLYPLRLGLDSGHSSRLCHLAIAPHVPEHLPDHCCETHRCKTEHGCKCVQIKRSILRAEDLVSSNPGSICSHNDEAKKSIKLVLNQHLHMNNWENLSGDNLRHSNAALLRTSAINREPADIDDTGNAW